MLGSASKVSTSAGAGSMEDCASVLPSYWPACMVLRPRAASNCRPRRYICDRRKGQKKGDGRADNRESSVAAIPRTAYSDDFGGAGLVPRKIMPMRIQQDRSTQAPRDPRRQKPRRYAHSWRRRSSERTLRVSRIILQPRSKLRIARPSYTCWKRGFRLTASTYSLRGDIIQ
jgi:hypothetical protein